MNAIIKNILLSDRSEKSEETIDPRLITINVALLFVIVVSSIFSIINLIEGLFIMFSIDILALFSSLVCLYLLRKNYDIEKIANFLIMMLFVVFISIILIRQAREYTLLWTLLFPVISIILKGTKYGFYYTVLYSIISLIIVYGFIGETITIHSYIRFMMLSFVLIALIYFNQYSMEKILLMLQESKAKVEELNSDLKKYSENVVIKSNELKERLELALIGNNDGVWDWNIITNEVYFSPRFKEILGYKEDELKNEFSLWIELIHPDDLENVLKEVTENTQGKTEYYQSTHRLRHKNGRWLWILDRGKTIFDADKKAIRMLGTYTDISEQKEIQRDLAVQYSLLHTIVDTVGVRIFWKDIEGYYLGANKLFLNDAHLGSIDDIIGKNDFQMPWAKTEAELYRADDLAVINSDIAKINFEETLTDDNGQTMVLLTSKIPLKDEEGNVIGVLGSYADVTEQRNTEEELKIQKDALSYQAYHDYLTGLPNRILFDDRLTQSIEKSKRNNTKTALLFIDLDHFKEINDSLGHQVGDEVLKEVTHRLNGVLRETDTLARLGGDEFTVVLENLHQAQDAAITAKKVLEVLVEPIKVDKDTLYVSSSIGISIYPDNGSSSEDLLKYADSAMYKAKAEGRNNFQFYSVEMTELAFERVVMEVSLRAALKNEEFVVYYQPQVNGLKNKVTGFEALVRWQHTSIGLIPPSKFIPLAESTGLIVELDRYVMKTAMNQTAQWYKNGFNPGVVSINLSVKQLEQQDFLSILQDMLGKTQCKAQWLELEVTESQIMTNPDAAIEVLKEISKLGISLAIDDFGTGYSSLAYLKRLPINKLKIDQSFIKDIPDDDEDVAITKAVIALSSSLRLQVIAEGVETKEQKEFLVENGCESIQGYYYSKPIPADELETILSNGLS